MPRLRRANCAGTGITRRRRGRGFAYYDGRGERVTDPTVLARIDALVIPPAWTDVWICPWANGHIQAMGTDAAGRRQYRYHDDWRVQRDAEKHERVLDFAKRLPQTRERLRLHLADRGLTRDRVLASAVRLLDLGFFRVGSEVYAEEHGTYGLATMRREHVSVSDAVVTFDYTAKGSQHRVQSVVDEDVRKVVLALKKRPHPGEELLAFRRGHTWYDVKSADINDYLREVTGGSFTAKDFRTWHATVLMAVALAVSSAASTPTARKRAVARAVREVADYLGNTPAVCRKSYIDPRVIDLYDDGITIAPTLEKLGADAEFGQLATHGAIEAAVLRMLRRPARASARRGSPPRDHAARVRRTRVA